MRGVVALCLLVMLVAGCTGDNNAVISGQGSKEGSTTQQVDCGSQGQLSIAVQGSGRVSIRVEDGAGAAVYSDAFSGNGQQGETVSLDGASGTWSLTASFSGSGSLPGMTDPGFQGQWAITLSC